MIHQRVISRDKDGLDDVGSLVMPVQWRMDARREQSRSLQRVWHDEVLQMPLEVVGIDPERVLYWDNNPERENSLRRVSYMLASRAVPMVVRGGNTMRNLVDRLSESETADLEGYAYSRIALARRVLAQLQTEPGERKGHYRSANLHVIFRYQPPQGEALNTLVGTLRGGEEE